ncbi:MAG: hypothetical protein B7733_11425 [Myxococcales bacterium FL481]|nr:MAG: hypothetical protein B7733_11425 [Myxococcales bacterium FL481]
MGALFASATGRVLLVLSSSLLGLWTALGLPDLDQIREIIRRVQEMLALGGMALATVASLLFLLVWVVSHLRRPSASRSSSKLLPIAALWSSYVPVGLTGVAAVGMFIPGLGPYILKSFALAVLLAAFSWVLSVAALVLGGGPRDLERARRAILLAGTPWYCLALYLARFL